MTKVMTNQAPNTRKMAQQIKSAGEQNERMLVRTITTILASVGTLVGWMALSAQAPVPVVEAVVEETPAPTETPAAPVVIDALIPTATVSFAPIPTLRAIPGRQILPTLMPTQSGAAAAPAEPATDLTVAAPTAAAQTLRVVIVPTAAAVEALVGGSTGGSNQPLPTAAANQPQPTAVPNAPKPTAVPKPKPTPAGNSKGSK
jgi:hypothetical protein